MSVSGLASAQTNTPVVTAPPYATATAATINLGGTQASLECPSNEGAGWSEDGLDPMWAYTCRHCLSDGSLDPGENALATYVPETATPYMRFPTLEAAEFPTLDPTQWGPAIGVTETSTPAPTPTIPGITPTPGQVYLWVDRYVDVDAYMQWGVSGQTNNASFSSYIPVDPIPQQYNIGWAFVGAAESVIGCTGSNCYVRLQGYDQSDYRLYDSEGVHNTCDLTDSSSFGLSAAAWETMRDAFCQQHFGVNDAAPIQWPASQGISQVTLGGGYYAGVTPSKIHVVGRYYNIRGALGQVATATPGGVPTNTPTPAPTATFSIGSGLPWSSALVDCREPVYVDDVPAVVGLDITQPTEPICVRIFPDVSGVLQVPPVDLCMRFFELQMSIFGLDVPVVSLLGLAAGVGLLRWALYM